MIGKGSSILVVDDNPSTLYSTSRVLRASGFTVLEATTGTKGLALADDVDLVVLDINLPDINGFEVCQQLKDRPSTARVPVVHLSASFVGDMDRVAGLNAGADGYLTHPVEPPVLVATINAFLRARRAENERERLLESERGARAEAERANRLKDEFLATLSHELRTPLNAIIGWSEVLVRQPGGADVLQGVKAIERNARLQAQLINDLLDVSSITSGKLRLELELVDPSSVLDASIAVVRSMANAKQIRLHRASELNAANNSTLIQADPARLQQIFWNLLSNAIKFTPKGGLVEVGLERIDARIRITIRDNGRGIEPDFLPHVFDRFRQSEAGTTRSSGGLGLGLAIVKHLVEMHGGTVQAESAGKSAGSTFSVELPIASISVLPAGIRPDRAPLSPAAPLHSVLNSLKVMVVEDDDDARLLVARVLREAGADVYEADSVDSALLNIHGFKPQILISDIGMSPRDGYEMIRKVRALGLSAALLPAVALTAFARMEDRRDVLFAGYQMHLSKPADPQELIAAVASLAGRTGSVAES